MDAQEDEEPIVLRRHDQPAFVVAVWPHPTDPRYKAGSDRPRKVGLHWVFTNTTIELRLGPDGARELARQLLEVADEAEDEEPA